MTEALVSVVIPAYNAAPYLGDAINSVLDQSYKRIDLIVIDDGSTDETAAIAFGFGERVRCIQQANRGMAGARNRGIAECRGDFVALLDADDTWMPTKLAKQMEALSAAPTFGACYTAFLVTDADLKPIHVQESPRRGTVLEDLLSLGNVVGSVSSPSSRDRSSRTWAALTPA